MNRVMAIGLFIGAVVAAETIWHFAWRAFSVNHADNPAVQGYAGIVN